MLLVSSALAGGVTSAAQPPIRPGAPIDRPAGCTLNFVFTDGTSLFIGTAAHCTDVVGDRVSTPTTGTFGTVVHRRLAGSDDVALIQIDADKHHEVGAALEEFGVPAGHTTASETVMGDAIGLEGNGVVFGASARSRVGVLAEDSGMRFVAELPAIFGDSGAPVVHLPTGKALGIVSGFAPTIPPSTVSGTTVERIVELAAFAGMDLQLVTE